MPEETAELKCPGRSARIHREIIAPASTFYIDGALVLESSAKVTR